MQFACLSIVFDHTKFQPRSVFHSGKDEPARWRPITIGWGRFFSSCVNRTKLKLLQQALLPSVQNPLHRFRRAMLVRYLQLYAAASTAVNSVRASLGEIYAMDSAQMAGELAGAVLASYGSHNLRKISPTDRYWFSLPGWLVFPLWKTLRG